MKIINKNKIVLKQKNIKMEIIKMKMKMKTKRLRIKNQMNKMKKF